MQFNYRMVDCCRMDAWTDRRRHIRWRADNICLQIRSENKYTLCEGHNNLGAICIIINNIYVRHCFHSEFRAILQTHARK